MFATVFTTARIFPCPEPHSSNPLLVNLIFFKSILISYPILRLGIQSGPSFSSLATQTLHPFTFYPSMCYMPHPSHSLLFYILCISTFKVILPANEMTGCGVVVCGSVWCVVCGVVVCGVVVCGVVVCGGVWCMVWCLVWQCVVW